MAEHLSSRVGRLVSATANMLVDAVENMAPEMVMEEAIREIDQAIDDIRAELGKVVAKQHMANTRLTEEGKRHDELSDKIRLALSEGREDLAETAVAQVIDIEAQIPILEATAGDTRDGIAELEGYISALQARKREMTQELAQFRDSLAAAAVPTSPGTGDDAPGGGGSVAANVRKAENAFGRALENAGGIVGSSSTPDQKTAAKRAELDEMARNNRIKERLEAFRSKED